jgi:hypothetical protein
MVRCALIYSMLTIGLFVGCGGGKKAPAPPKPVVKPPPPVETEADREKKRAELAETIVPAGSTCLPLALKGDNPPRLELAAVGKDVVVCAIDTDRTRLLGPVGCWKVAVDTGALTYQDGMKTGLPGGNVDVLPDDQCVRGFCMPKDAKIADAKIAHMSSNLDGTKVAVLLGDDVHIFDGASKAHESAFSIRGDNGVTGDPIAVHFVGDAIFVEGAGEASATVWQFKNDGTAAGPLVPIGGKPDKPLSTLHGSFSVLDPDHVAINEHGLDALHTFEISTGSRKKAVRKVGKPTCKPDEIDAFWHDGDKVTDKCRASMTSLYGPYLGATALMGSKSLVVMLRDSRLGELGVLDPKSLAEKKAIKMPWCEQAGDSGKAAAKE